MEKKYREELFLYINGIVIIPTLRALSDLNILNYMNSTNSFSLDELIEEFKVNPGYINVALRTLLSIKLLYRNDNDIEQNIYYIDKEYLKTINGLHEEIKICSDLTYEFLNFRTMILDNLKPPTKTINLFKECNRIFDRLEKEIIENGFKKNIHKYLIGSVLGPILSNIGFLEKNLDNLKVKSTNLHLNINSIFKNTKLINNNNSLTDKGLFFNKRLASFGVTTSYLPLLNNLKSILTTNTNFIREVDDNGDEKHVNRRMNVWGSGGAHKYYFKKIDNIIINIFNKEIENQPIGIIDIGCGDGTFLKHCYDLIITKTIRKKYLDSHPIILIGIDINKAARIATRKKLNESYIDNIIINGNISDPDSINKSISNEYDLKLEDFINTRTFLDHNRIYTKPKEIKFNKINSSGVFAFRGKIITKNELLNNLIEHFIKWKKYIYKHGLIILELHTVNAKRTANNQSKLLSCSYDATHGYSDQYLVEYDTFIKCANLANMQLYFKSELFPNNENPTISINYFI